MILVQRFSARAFAARVGRVGCVAGAGRVAGRVLKQWTALLRSGYTFYNHGWSQSHGRAKMP